MFWWLNRNCGQGSSYNLNGICFIYYSLSSNSPLKFLLINRCFNIQSDLCRWWICEWICIHMFVCMLYNRKKARISILFRSITNYIYNSSVTRNIWINLLVSLWAFFLAIKPAVVSDSINESYSARETLNYIVLHSILKYTTQLFIFNVRIIYIYMNEICTVPWTFLERTTVQTHTIRCIELYGRENTETNINTYG
jgi:hypothetical protein